MQDFLMANYLWIKSFHIIAVISWMAGLLYLPRLFVYHAQQEKGSSNSEMLKTMERKLLKYIMSPAMMATWILGIALMMAFPEIFKNGWMHVKFALVILMTVFHVYCKRIYRQFENDTNTKDQKFFRYINEVPTILMIIIVICVVAKPF